MLTVHVWGPMVTLKHRLAGHASISVGSAYISWWPETGVFNTSPYRIRTLQMDIEAEAKRSPENTVISGLNEKAILDWWCGFGLQCGGQSAQGPMLPYDLAKQNCSTVAAMALRAGGGDAYAGGWWVKNNLVWTPRDVGRYARAINDGLRAKATGKK
ncbi:MAG: hypothetical protein IBJ18_05280 [Phycisphaerales bacterium]|nr:hypothetical protein [Phycisphaerales bacterium]